VSEIDRDVVQMGYREFQEFADENIGKVDLNDPHLAGLIDFYDKATKALRKDAQGKVKNEEERMKQWNSIVNDQRELDKKRAKVRKQRYVDGMKNFSQENLWRQYQKSNGIRITNGSFGSPTARLNCDRWRPFAATPVAKIDTTSTIYFAEKTSKYNTFNVEVENMNEYIDVYMYVFADGIRSYQRLKGENGVFDCQMNNEIKYAIGIVGLTESGYAFYEHDFLIGGNLGKVTLKEISQIDLESRIEKMNVKRLKSGIKFEDDLDWLKTKRLNYKVQRRHQEMVIFRRNVKSVIFPCVTFQYNGWLRADAIIEEN
jgi:hypothetical protein